MSEGAYLRIGELSRRAGVSPELLRAWERRYGLLQPERTAGGFRLYTDADLERVRGMQADLRKGISAAEAARLALTPPSAESDPVEETPTPNLTGALADLAQALDAYDEVRAQSILDQVLAVYSLDAVLQQVVLPLLRDLGDRSTVGESSIAQEHFASNVLRGRLMSLARGWGQGRGPIAVLACPPNELHDIALVAFGLALRARGWRITFLGTNTPVETIAETAAAVSPAVVVVAAEMERHLSAVADLIAALASEVPVAIAGEGATPDLASRTGATCLRGDPIAAADRLSGVITPAPTRLPAA